MISEIAIKNLAIIDDIRISFTDNLNILTGETGAGKSIIINAINMILGDRASSKLIRTGEESAEVEAQFIIEKDSPTYIKMLENDFDPEKGLIVRRIIAKNNRHKIYINQKLVTAQTLNEITRNLASVSGQHEHQSLLDEKNNIYFLDSFAGLNDQRNQINAVYSKINELKDKLRNLKKRKKELERDSELILFQIQEIEEAQLKDNNEDMVLEQELKKLANAKKLIEAATKSSNILYTGTNSVSEAVALVKKDLEYAASIDKNFEPFLEQISSVYAEIEDLGQSLESYTDEIENDEEKLSFVQDRIELINRLKSKYGSSIEKIKSYYLKIKDSSTDFENTDKNIKKTQELLNKELDNFFVMAKKLSQKRKKAALQLEEVITGSIKELEMPHAKFFASLISDENQMDENGIDKVELLISPNPGEDPKPISETASGGELSRLVLAIKSATAQTDHVSTIIFDEADSGIGGKAAEKTGYKIKTLSNNCQIICITHLTQIAKFADTHFYIEKNVEENRTKTSIKKLSQEERVYEIARMIAGEHITTKTLENAKELIEQAYSATKIREK